MVTPHAHGIARAIRSALADAGGEAAGRIGVPGYVNTHGPSTPSGDVEEVRAMRDVWGTDVPLFSSTKGFTGHPLGACGAHEAIYALLMMRDGFIAGNAPIENADPCVEGMPLVRATRDAVLERVMSVSFGFGGSCASLLFDAWKEA
jgi:3-oxoacyl-[acyl-carrier-protein] synthase-1